MDVVDIDHPLDFLELLLELVDVDVGGGRLHHQVVCVLEDGEGGSQSDDGEDVGGDGIEQVPCVPFMDWLQISVGASQQENHQRTEDKADTHDHIG